MDEFFNIQIMDETTSKWMTKLKKNESKSNLENMKFQIKNVNYVCHVTSFD
jgi:hypothetical protein